MKCAADRRKCCSGHSHANRLLDVQECKVWRMKMCSREQRQRETERQWKVDRVTANHSLSSTAIQQKFQHSLSLLSQSQDVTARQKNPENGLARSSFGTRKAKGNQGSINSQEPIILILKTWLLTTDPWNQSLKTQQWRHEEENVNSVNAIAGRD